MGLKILRMILDLFFATISALAGLAMMGWGIVTVLHNPSVTTVAVALVLGGVGLGGLSRGLSTYGLAVDGDKNNTAPES